MHKRWILQPVDENIVQQLTQDLNVNAVLCRLIALRGINTFDAAKRFFRPALSELHDPFLMHDMDKAVSRLEAAIAQQERVLLYGDYDVDGTTSVALMHGCLENHLENLDIYTPDRYKEGYGISNEGVEYAHQNGITLVIAMDCGIKAVSQIALANEYGIDFIICDHHVPDDVLPAAVAILDPKRSDCVYPFKELSGCGIAFKLAQAYLQKNNLPVETIVKTLDLLVTSIACDVVSMRDENRVLAYFGLEQLNTDPRHGIRALIEERGKTFPVDINDLVFGIGPLINAAGRLADARLAVRLLLAADPETAKDLAQQLTQQNNLRREVEVDIMKLAHELAQKDFDAGRKSLVLFSPDWHKGVLGIVAARIAEQWHRPTVILAEMEGKIMGSVRTVAEFDVYKVLHSCQDLLVSFGGHAFAAGLVLLPENLEAFSARFEAAAQADISPAMMIPELHISAMLPPSAITDSFYNTLKQFAPFGPDNMRPVFLALNLKEEGLVRASANGAHLLVGIRLPDGKVMQGVAFGLGHLLEDFRYANFDMCYVLDESTYNGKTSLRFQVRDLKIKASQAYEV